MKHMSRECFYRESKQEGAEIIECEKGAFIY